MMLLLLWIRLSDLPQCPACPVTCFGFVLFVCTVVPRSEVCAALFVLVLGVVTHRGVTEMDGLYVPFWGFDEDCLLLAGWGYSSDLTWFVQCNLATFPCISHVGNLQISFLDVKCY